MANKGTRTTWAGLLLVAGTMLAAPGAAWAQAVDVEVEPINCWWRTTAEGVRMGEPFTVVLTCAVLETEATRIVPDQSRLEPTVVQLPPFEVLGGSRAPDLRTATRRFFQYSYTVRIVDEGAFGMAVDIPSVTVNYAVEQRSQGGEAVRGRDQEYAMPALPVQVLSVVPDTARGIKEPEAGAFGGPATREFRGQVLKVAGGILAGLGALMLLIMIIRVLVQGRAKTADARPRLVSDAAVMSGVTRELDRIRAESLGSWTPELGGRLLAAARLTASVGLGRAISRRPASSGELREGELKIGRAIVSGSATADHVANARGAAESRLRGLDDALRALTAERYGPEPSLDSAGYDEALAATAAAASRVAADHTLVARAVSAAQQTVAGWTERIWAR
ncbi:MAG: hypothetical protein AB1635_18495 [Acidobacteriota bacterium]